MIKAEHHDRIKLHPDYLKTLFRRHLQGALVRSGASFIMWVFAFFAFFVGIIKAHHFIGVSSSVLYLILINLPTLLVLRKIAFRRLYRYFSTFINLLEIIGYTGVIYFLGGIEATYLTPIYAALITYVGGVSPRRRPFEIAALCAAAFSLMVLLEGFGFLPNMNVNPDFNLPATSQIIFVSVVMALLFVVAYISSFTAGLLKKNRDRLRKQNMELEERARIIENAENKLRIAHQDLEKRVEERTRELSKANKRLLDEIQSHDITTEALRESEEKYHLLFDNAADLIAVIDTEGNFLELNERFEVESGYRRDEMVGKNAFTAGILADSSSTKALFYLKEILEGDEAPIFEVDGIRKDGGIIHYELRAVPIKKDGEIEAVQAILRNINDRKLVEEEVKKSLREKEQLLKEIHHRVKNNLQVISSLLSLQTDHSQDRQFFEMLKDSQDRIRSMALIHEKLYQSEDMSEIDFSRYIVDLVTQLLNTYGVDSSLIKLKFTGENVFLGLDISIPCGLIINELISNALKHAFPNGKEGEISIYFQPDANGKFDLIVSDNGVGMPKGLDFNNTRTLGLQLVNTLVNQLDGTIELDVREGVSFRISFPGNQ